MWLDERNEFCDATSVVKTAGASYLIGDVIDLESTGLNLGIAVNSLWLVIQTDTEIITGGAAGSMKFHLCSDAQAAIAVDGSASYHFSTGALVTDDAAANSAKFNAGGVIACVQLPADTYERYLGIVVEVTTTDTTAGKVNAFLTPNPAAWLAFADAQN